MTTVTIPLDKNPEIKALVADMEAGAPICLYGTVKSVDAQTLIVTVEEAEEGEMKHSDEPAAEGSEPTPGAELAAEPAKSMASSMAEKLTKGPSSEY